MGKRGNRVRREAKRLREVTRHASLNENIQAILREDEWKQDVENSSNEDYETSLEKIYGVRGPPKEDNVIYLGAPPKVTKHKTVDLLGRVVEVDTLPSKNLRQIVAERKKADTLVIPGPTKRVTLMRASEHVYPELWMEIFVQPDPTVRDDEARFAHMFAQARCSRAKSVLEADLVVFGGGSDVDPALYGERPYKTTCFDPKRDGVDMALYLLCVEHGIPMLGVCRGAQFLHVMNGGKLYQDIDKHYGDHKIYDVAMREFIYKVSSVHHQACRPNRDNGQTIIATNGDARKRWLNDKEDNHGAKADIEAFFYRDTCCLGVQGHPEYKGYTAYTKYVLELINHHILCSPDIECRDGNRRVKKELLEERKLITEQITSMIAEAKEL